MSPPTLRRRPGVRSRPALLGVLALALAAGRPPAAAADRFLVDDLADEVDASVGDGRCATTLGACTLRAAIQEANAREGPDRIELHAEGLYPLVRSRFGPDAADTGDLDLTDDVTLVGLGPDRTRVDATLLRDQAAFEIAPASVLEMEAADGSQASAWTPAGGGRVLDETRVVSQGHASLLLFAREYSPASMTVRLGLPRDWRGATLLVDIWVISDLYLGDTEGVRIYLSSDNVETGFENAKYWDFGNRDVTPGVFSTLRIPVAGTPSGVLGSPDMGLVRALRIEANRFRPLAGRQYVFDHVRLLPPSGVERAPVVTLEGLAVESGAPGIRNRGALAVRDLLLFRNTTGLVNRGTLSAVDLVARENREGALWNGSAGIAEVTRARFELNSGYPAGEALSEGAGIRNAGQLDLAESVLERNVATRGGGLHNQEGAVATVRACALVENIASEGGGIWNAGSLTVENTTLSQNHAEEEGGGLWSGGEATLSHVTLARNASSTRGPALAAPGGRVALGASLLAGNASPAGFAACTEPNLVSLGHNLQETLDRADACGLLDPTDLRVLRARLGPLADHGGPTPTHVPEPGSPAIDAIGPGPCPPRDQRGSPRPADGDGDGIAGCDIGAVEVSDDGDGDGVPDAADLCPRTPDPGQSDRDGDGIGDACECGDFNRDGFVNTTDARLVQRCATGAIPCGGLCDATGDAVCNTSDARLIQRVAVGRLGKNALHCAARP